MRHLNIKHFGASFLLVALFSFCFLEGRVEAGVRGSLWTLTAQELPLVPKSPNAGQEVKILSDKVYLYNYFNVLFKTPFRLGENIRVSVVDSQQGRVRRTGRQTLSLYLAADEQRYRAFILVFYTVAPGLHQLPRLRFHSLDGKLSWQSPSISFASFRVDENALPLPVNIELNNLPQKVYLGQNIIVNVWAKRVEAIDQSWLLRPPEFKGFLMQESPVQPHVERQNILGKDVYRLSLATWLLNPIAATAVEIPVITASVMGLKRQTLARQLKVLPLPPNPYQEVDGSEFNGLEAKGNSSSNDTNLLQEKAIIIGHFKTSLRLLAPATQTLLYNDSKSSNSFYKNKSKFKRNTTLKTINEFAKDELIHLILRVSGSGNIHLLPFPQVYSSPDLVLLQSYENESLQLDFASAELSGWRERELIYKAKRSGKYRVKAASFSFFDPKQGRWKRTQSHEQSLEVVNLATKSYYSNLEELNFSQATIFFIDLIFGLQKYSFYICLVIFLLSSAYIFLHIHNLLEASKRYIFVVPPPKNNSYLLLSYLCLILLSLSFSFQYRLSLDNESSRQQKIKQHYLELLHNDAASQDNLSVAELEKQLQKLPNTVGQIPNIALLFYRNGLALSALKISYLGYFQVPLNFILRRLVVSMRLQQGLTPSLPNFFFWPLQLKFIWRLLSIVLCLFLSIYFIKQKYWKNKNNDRIEFPFPFERLPSKFLYPYRNYSIIMAILLLSLSIPWHFSLAVNTNSSAPLKSIPNDSKLPLVELNDNSTIVEQQHSRNNNLHAGELVKIKGRANGSYILVISEKNTHGWLDESKLFYLSTE